MKDCPVTTEMSLRVLGKLRAMRGDVISTLGGYGIEIDSCRINQILSSGMEKFLADELVSVDPDTTNDDTESTDETADEETGGRKDRLPNRTSPRAC